MIDANMYGYEFYLSMIKSNATSLLYVPENLMKDKDFLNKAYEENT